MANEISYGIHSVESLLEKAPEHIDYIVLLKGAPGGKLKKLAALANKRGVKVVYHPKPAIDQLAKTSKHQGALAVSRKVSVMMDESDVLALIDAKNPGLIIKFGGHAMAAGLSVAEKDFPTFSTLFDNAIRDCVDPDILENTLMSDGELTSNDITLPVAQLLREAGPWGQHFPEPMFDGKFSIVEQRLVGTNHLKLVLGATGSEHAINAIAFNVNTDAWPNERCQKINAAYRLDVNEFRGVKSVQLIIEHLEEEGVS